MYDIFTAWIGNVSNISSDLVFVFACIASLLILHFLLDFFRFLMYYVSGR